MCRELAGEGTKVGRAAKLRGCSKLGREDNQGGAKLSRALKDATRRMNLTLQPRHTQHCFAIVFIIQLPCCGKAENMNIENKRKQVTFLPELYSDFLELFLGCEQHNVEFLTARSSNTAPKREANFSSLTHQV